MGSRLARAALRHTLAYPWIVADAGVVPAPSGDEPWTPSQGWRTLPHHLQVDELWGKIRNEARRDAVGHTALAYWLSLCRLCLSAGLFWAAWFVIKAYVIFGLQEQEGALASFLHSSILAHSSLKRSMAVLLANKLSSHTLPGTQLLRLITEAFDDDPVGCPCSSLRAVYLVGLCYLLALLRTFSCKVQ